MSKTSRLRSERALWSGSCLLFEVGLSQLFELGTRVKRVDGSLAPTRAQAPLLVSLPSTPLTYDFTSDEDTSFRSCATVANAVYQTHHLCLTHRGRGRRNLRLLLQGIGEVFETGVRF